MPSSASSPPPPLALSEIVVGGLTLVAVAAATWGFGGRAPWAPPVFTALATVAVLAALGLSRREHRPIRWGPFVPFLCFGGLVALSLLNPSHYPLPGSDGWRATSAWISWLPATLDRTITLQQMLPWAAAFMLFGALTQTAFSSRGVRLFWGGLLAHGIVVALVGIYFHVTTPYEILGLIRDRHGYHFASFVYRNHWAAAVILMVPIALGFSFSALRRWANGKGPFDAMIGGFGIALLFGITLPMPGTRSGLVAFCGLMIFSLIKLGIIIIQARRASGTAGKWIQVSVIAALVLLVTIGSLFLTKNPLERHWQRTKNQWRGLASGQSELRLRFTQDTLRMAADRPWWGWGVGSFGFVFPRYHGDYLRDRQGTITTRVMHAHNDWAEIAAETGLVGFLLFLWFVLRRIRRGWLAQSVLERWITGGVTLLLFYALVDFPLHNPAVLLMTISLLATIGRTSQPAISGD